MDCGVGINQIPTYLENRLEVGKYLPNTSKYLIREDECDEARYDVCHIPVPGISGI